MLSSHPVRGKRGRPRTISGSIAVLAGVLAFIVEARAQSMPAAGRSFPPVADLPIRPEFPDPLVMFDGRRVTTRAQWFNERRPELIALFQHYMYGTFPPSPKEVRAKLEREDRRFLEGRATLKEVTVTFGELPPIHLMLIIPNGRPGPAPVVLSLNYFGNHTLSRDPAVRLNPNWMPQRGAGVVDHHSTEASRGSWIDPRRNLFWDIEQLIARGYALATFYNGDIESDPDREDGRAPLAPARKLSPDCGTIGAWAWGLSRAVDYLVTDAAIDRNRIVVTGHSRLGKAALLAAAMDERIALAIPHQAGTGGSGPSRVKPPATPPPPRQNGSPAKPPETVKNLNDAFPSWCNDTFKQFNDRPERLPFDQHCLVALCAPRPVLFTNGRADTWINPEGQFEVLRAAAPVYRFLGAGDFAATALPPDGKLIDSKLGYFIRPGGHTLLPGDWTVFLDFADQQLGAPKSARVPQVR
jgi:hypothetical protein